MGIVGLTLGASGVCDLHVRLDGPAQGRHGSARGRAIWLEMGSVATCGWNSSRPAARVRLMRITVGRLHAAAGRGLCLGARWAWRRRRPRESCTRRCCRNGVGTTTVGAWQHAQAAWRRCAPVLGAFVQAARRWLYQGAGCGVSGLRGGAGQCSMVRRRRRLAAVWLRCEVRRVRRSSADRAADREYARLYFGRKLRAGAGGVAGELYIGGAGVARGYLNRPELTAEKFLADPFTSEPGARMYRSGDLGRWLPDGTIEFLGRNDFQVKIRGFRIELGEIEARLAEHAEVREAVVIAREDTPGDKRLVAYYTAAETEQPVEAERLREHLLARLPEYMAPAAYVHLPGGLPLTSNGKLDRRALPAPAGDAYARRSYEEPQGETETTLAQIWAEALKLERVGRHDNFFELGGHSLLVVTLIERMRRRRIQADVKAIFAGRRWPRLAGRKMRRRSRSRETGSHPCVGHHAGDAAAGGT